MMKMTVDQRFMMPADVVERVEVLQKQTKQAWHIITIGK